MPSRLAGQASWVLVALNLSLAEESVDALPLCANINETSCVTAISEQGGKETQHGNDER